MLLQSIKPVQLRVLAANGSIVRNSVKRLSHTPISTCRHRRAHPFSSTTLRNMSLPARIKAVGIRETGDFDVIKDLELPLPVPAPDEILVKVCI